jgi:hypothetical protein
LTALALGGCGLFTTETPPPCLPVVVLGDAAERLRYREGAGRDLTDVVDHAKFTRFATKCDYSKGQVEVQLLLDILVERGPATSERTIRVPYFVAVVDTGQRILAKEVFESVAEIPEGQRRAVVREETEQIIQLANVGDRTRYEIMIGFQLTREQLEDNRRRRQQ